MMDEVKVPFSAASLLLLLVLHIDVLCVLASGSSHDGAASVQSFHPDRVLISVWSQRACRIVEAHYQVGIHRLNRQRTDWVVVGQIVSVPRLFI